MINKQEIIKGFEELRSKYYGELLIDNNVTISKDFEDFPSEADNLFNEAKDYALEEIEKDVAKFMSEYCNYNEEDIPAFEEIKSLIK